MSCKSRGEFENLFCDRTPYYNNIQFPNDSAMFEVSFEDTQLRDWSGKSIEFYELNLRNARARRWNFTDISFHSMLNSQNFECINCSFISSFIDVEVLNAIRGGEISGTDIAFTRKGLSSNWTDIQEKAIKEFFKAAREQTESYQSENQSVEGRIFSFKLNHVILSKLDQLPNILEPIILKQREKLMCPPEDIYSSFVYELPPSEKKPNKRVFVKIAGILSNPLLRKVFVNQILLTAESNIRNKRHAVNVNRCPFLLKLNPAK